MPFWTILYKNCGIDSASLVPRLSTVYPKVYPQAGPFMKAPLPLLVSGLGVAQIVSWGSLYYPISVLGDSMQRDLGVTSTVLFAAFTLSLLISGLAAPAIGRLMEAYGARTVLCAGSLLGMTALLLLSRASGPVSLFGGALVAGAAMAACLEDAALLLGRRARWRRSPFRWAGRTGYRQRRARAGRNRAFCLLELPDSAALGEQVR
ncbi:MAG: hypothetical protein JWM30_4071 [Burkholderia sp.]|nr:hypothetical protein [Burkholderia sp.]